MDVAITIVMLVPVLLAVALIIGVIRRNITERQAGDPVDISGAIPAVIVLMVAVLIIVAMGNAASPYVYDEDSGELTIQKNVPELDVQPWDSYASDVKSLIIQDNVTVATGAFDTMANLEYVSIGEGSQIASGAFAVDFFDAYDQEQTSPSGDFVGFGDGELYMMADASMLTVGTLDGKPSLSGFSATAGDVVNLVVPASVNGQTLKSVRYNAFQGSAIQILLFAPDSQIEKLDTSCFYQSASLVKAGTPKTLTTINSGAFNECTSLETIALHDGVTAIPFNAFRMCSALQSIAIPSTVKEFGSAAFYQCESLESLEIPEGVEVLTYNAFNGCAALETVSLPSTITTIGASIFANCTAVASVSFAEGFAPESLSSTWCPWTFYDTDGTTTLDKAVASNLAGFVFQGTASALVKVAPGQLTLTPDQIQQVHLHDAELQDLKDHLTIDPLPFQPSLQTQEQEPVSA